MNVLNQLIESRFAIYNGDSVEVLKGLPDDSVTPYLARHLVVCMSTLILIGIWATQLLIASFGSTSSI